MKLTPKIFEILKIIEDDLHGRGKDLRVGQFTIEKHQMLDLYDKYRKDTIGEVEFFINYELNKDGELIKKYGREYK